MGFGINYKGGKMEVGDNYPHCFELDIDMALERIEKKKFPLGLIDWRKVLELIKDCVKRKGD